MVASQDPSGKQGVDRAIEALRRDFILVGKTHVRAWDAWVVLGAFVGIVFATVLIANRSGEVGSSNAAVPPPPPPPPIQVLAVVSPNGGELWTTGSRQAIRWTGGSKSDRIRIWLDQAPTPQPPGQSAKTLPASTLVANNLSNSGSFLWNIPARTKASSYLIRICTTRNAASACSMTDTSNGSFMITPVPPTNISPKIVSVSPYPTSISPGQLVGFSLSATDADNDDLSWSVDWGDGTGVNGTCEIPHQQKGQHWTYDDSHAWASAGDYVAKFTVGDCRGGSDWYSYNIHVAVPPKPKVLNVSVDTTPAAQNVMRGTTGFTFANIILDAAGADEDVRITSMQAQYNYAVGSDLANCQLWDGVTALNNGSNIVNPGDTPGASFRDYTFPLDNFLVVQRDTKKIVSLKCSAWKYGRGDYAQWTLSSDENIAATGLISGNKFTSGVASSTVANKMTLVNGGTLSVALDPSSPTFRLAQAGQETTVAMLRLSAAKEDIALSQIALKLGGSAVPSDIVTYSLWNGATKVGEVFATSSASGIIVQTSGVTVSRDGDKIITVKAQLSDIGVGQPGRPGANVAVDWDQVNVNGVSATYGVGLQSSSYIYAAGSDTQSAGVIVYRGYPTIATLPIPSTLLSNGTQQDLYRFSISAPAGTNGVSLYKMTFNVSTTSGNRSFSITNLKLYAYTGAGFSGDAYANNPLNSGSLFGSSDSQVDAAEGDRATTTDYAIYFNPSNPSSTTFATGAEALHVPAGSTYYFDLKGNVTGANSGDSAAIQLLGDAAFAALNTPQAVDLLADDDFIWSGNSTTTHSGAAGASGADWTNGYLVPGLPSQGSVINVLSQ